MSDSKVTISAFKRMFPELYEEAINVGSDGNKVYFTLTNSRQAIFNYVDDENYSLEMKEIY